MKLCTATVDDTLALGVALARVLSGGTLVCLLGQLGGGKTHLVKGIVAGLGGAGAHVTSPTFTLLQSYATSGATVHHADLYRLADGDEVPEEILEALGDPAAITCIEWADLFPEVWRAPLLELEFEHAGDDRRIIHLRSEGLDAQRIKTLVAPYICTDKA